MKGSDHWTQKLELRLVKLYKKFHCLWMMGSPSYNDLDQRYAAYVTIVETLKPQFSGLTVPKVVYKIRDLRHRYCVELTKIKRADGTRGKDYTPNLLWFNVMRSFLDLGLRSDGIKGSEGIITQSGRTAEASSSTCQTIYKSHLKMEDSKSTVGEFEESGNDAVNCTDDVWSEIIRGCAEAEESGRANEIEDHPVHFSEMKRCRQEYSSDIKMPRFDEFDAFAVSIGSQLKRLDPGLVGEIEIRILMILHEERTSSPVLTL